MGYAVAVFDSMESRDALSDRWGLACQHLVQGPEGISVKDMDHLSVALSGHARSVQSGHLTFAISGRRFRDRAIPLHSPLQRDSESLRRDLKSDVDRLVESWAASGVRSLRGLSGSFTFCVHDARNGSLSLVRDRFGTRPLFYCRQPGVTLTSTDPRVLLRMLPEWEIDPNALMLAVRFRFHVQERYLVSPLRQVQAATAVRVGRNGEEYSEGYWYIPFDSAPAGRLHEWVDKTHGALREFFEFEGLEREAVGVLLSGGVDSTVIAAAAKESCREVIGYVARFRNRDDQESSRALAVAEHLGIACNVLEFDEDRLEADLRELMMALCAPPLHPNNLVLLQLYQRAALDVRTVLQGDAAEMMFGLADSRRVSQFARKRAIVERALPPTLRLAFVEGLKKGDASWRWRLARVLERDVREYALSLDEIRYSRPVQRIADAEWNDARPDFPFSEMLEAYSAFDDGLQAYQARTFLQCSLDRHYWLGELTGVHSIAPFVSEPLVDVAGRLPRALRYTDTARPVIKALCDRIAHPGVSRWKKLGFPVPWTRWMDGPLSKVRGRPEDYRDLEPIMPSGFIEAAWRARDPEALWLLMTLRMLMEDRG